MKEPKRRDKKREDEKDEENKGKKKKMMRLDHGNYVKLRGKERNLFTGVERNCGNDRFRLSKNANPTIIRVAATVINVCGWIHLFFTEREKTIDVSHRQRRITGRHVVNLPHDRVSVSSISR